MVAVSDLEFRYAGSDFCLRIPELLVDRGTTVAVIGPSGTGKTTLLNLIAGIVTPSQGKITAKGVEINSLGDRDRRDFRVQHMGLVFQEFELLEYLSVLDNIVLPYRINAALGLARPVWDRAGELADRVGIGDKLRRNVNRLSQGERQRVAVCRALLTGPELLLADEPTGNLDPANKGRVLDILFEYCAEFGATLITVTHDHDLVSRFDRVVDFHEFHENGVHSTRRANP